MNEIILIADELSQGIRIDKWLSIKIPDKTRNFIQNIIKSGNVKVNEIIITKNYVVKCNDKISVIIPEPEVLEVLPEKIDVEIIYEDNDLLIVNKPKGMVVHPAPGNYTGTLVNALLYHCKERLSSINGVIRPGIVHRIDKNTSGLLIVAKNDSAHNHLAKQIKTHSFTREYEAIVCGNLSNNFGTINAPIGRNKNNRKKMAVTQINSKLAVTHYEVITKFSKHTHLKLKLETGRTHQIRVHMAYIGHPVLGDDVYGKAYKGLDGQCLHAKRIGFIHPTLNQYMEFDSQLPDYFVNTLRRIS